MSAEQYRNELDQLHASPELKARLAALQNETPPAVKPPKLRLAKRAGASVVAAAACLMLCVAVWRGEMLSGKGGFSAADASSSPAVAEYSVQMDESMREAAAPERGTETAAAESTEGASADKDSATGAAQETDASAPSEASGAEAGLLPENAMLRVNGELYRYAGRQSDALRCGMMDGMVTAVTASGEMPTEDNQANFGTVGMGYQYGPEGTVEVYLEEADAWLVFEAVEEGAAQP